MTHFREDILLSICIPTFNRAKYLKSNLEALFREIDGKNMPIEIIVSDNCSTDDTENTVRGFIIKGLPLNYIKNSINLGMDGNFAQCYREAKGKYVLALGDDDYLIEGMLEKLISILESGDYGLVHLHPRGIAELSTKEFTDTNCFLEEISFWITYITSNIVNKTYIEKYNFEQYFGSYLAIVPLYLKAALGHNQNLMVYDRIFKDGSDIKSNGGYNFFKVFVINYLNIWKDFLKSGRIKRKLYYRIKKDIFRKYLLFNAYNLLYLKTKNNYNLEGSILFLIRTYFYHPYFYYYTCALIAKKSYGKINVVITKQFRKST